MLRWSHCVPSNSVKECICSHRALWVHTPDDSHNPLRAEETSFDQDVDTLIEEMDHGLSGFMGETYPFIAVSTMLTRQETSYETVTTIQVT
ncbi:MAG: hypothetical protein ACXABY_20315 [Candidatus Thorarchaeota archaeon]|jgi:hypothetical protein